MDEPSYWWQTGIAVVLAGFAFIGRRAVDKVDDHGKRITELEQSSVSESDLENTITRFEGSMKETKAAVDQTNKTVLELWKFLAEKK